MIGQYEAWLDIARTVLKNTRKPFPKGIEYQAADAAWHQSTTEEAVTAMAKVFEEARNNDKSPE